MDDQTKRMFSVALTIAVLVVTCVLMIVFLGGPAKAADKTNWTGCYAGASLGYSAGHHNAGLDMTGVGSVDVDGLSTQGMVVSPHIGCDLQLDRVVVGGFADYSWHNDSEFSITADIPGLFTGDVAKTAIDHEWSVGGRAGFLVNDDLLAYGLVAYSKMSMDDLTGLGGTPIEYSYEIREMTGWALGGGLEASLGNGWFLKGEYRYTMYDVETVNLIPDALDLDIESDVQTARLGFSYRFNFSSVIPPVSLK